jgi:hypothetical protein
MQADRCWAVPSAEAVPTLNAVANIRMLPIAILDFLFFLIACSFGLTEPPVDGAP